MTPRVILPATDEPSVTFTVAVDAEPRDCTSVLAVLLVGIYRQRQARDKTQERAQGGDVGQERDLGGEQGQAQHDP